MVFQVYPPLRENTVILNSRLIFSEDLKVRAEKVVRLCFNLPVKWEHSFSVHKVLRFPKEAPDDANRGFFGYKAGTPERGCLYCAQLEEYLRIALGT